MPDILGQERQHRMRETMPSRERVVWSGKALVAQHADAPELLKAWCTECLPKAP